ncbi:hypothetical protein LINPERPRIM_LOCUS18101, partial [Linum perenne]
GLRKIILQIDSTTIIVLLTSEPDTNHQHGAETLMFWDFRNLDWSLVVKHTYKEDNHAADFLAKHGL